ncbi:MAG: CvpA family protein [Bacilli bacterium]|nr:CvpA family protein [Bacilli bacterium]
MNIGIVDIVVIIFLILGAALGFKRGIVKSFVGFIGLVIALILAWYLKNPISEFMYTHLPFFSFKGGFALLNIVIYEIIAFLIIAIILLTIVKLITIFTGLVDKLVGLASGLGIISKILGLVFGVIENYVIAFLVLFILYSFTTFNTTINENELSSKMLSSTPVLSTLVKDEMSSLQEIFNIKLDFNESGNYDDQLFDILLKYKVISIDTAEKLVSDNKVQISNASEIIKKYK